MTLHTQLSAVLALYEETMQSGCGEYTCYAFHYSVHDLIRQHGKDLLAAVEGWVSVDDRLPDLDVPVWACGPNDHPFIGARVFDCDGWLWGKCYSVPCVDSDGKWDCEDCEVDDDYAVTRWRPLPPPPAAMTKESAK